MREMLSTIPLMRLSDAPTMGGQDTRFYPIVLGGSQHPRSSLVNKNDGKTPKPYRISGWCNIARSRLNAKTSASSSYYELLVTVDTTSDEWDPQLYEALKDMHTSMSASLPTTTNPTDRHALYINHDSEYVLSVRVFEYFSSKKATPGSNDKKPGVSIHIMSKAPASDGPSICEVTVDDPRYRNYEDVVKVVFAPNSMFVSNTYKKMVFTARTLLLRDKKVTSIGGVTTRNSGNDDVQAFYSSLTADEKLSWNECQRHMMELAKSGFPIDGLTSVMKRVTIKHNDEPTVQRSNDERNHYDTQSNTRPLRDHSYKQYDSNTPLQRKQRDTTSSPKTQRNTFDYEARDERSAHETSFDSRRSAPYNIDKDFFDTKPRTFVDTTKSSSNDYRHNDDSKDDSEDDDNGEDDERNDKDFQRRRKEYEEQYAKEFGSGKRSSSNVFYYEDEHIDKPLRDSRRQ
jgi:hypothetical protein